jgi:hypothetical protein
LPREFAPDSILNPGLWSEIELNDHVAQLLVVQFPIAFPFAKALLHGDRHDTDFTGFSAVAAEVNVEDAAAWAFLPSITTILLKWPGLTAF